MCDMTQLTGILKFVELTHKFEQIKRKIYATGENRQENNAEHSYQTAMVAWYLFSTQSLKLNFELVIKYALLHDLVEVYAGDPHFFDHKAREQKKEKERLSAIRLKEEFPEFLELHALIAQYDKKSDPESRFVSALDKLIPIMNVYLDNGRSWQEDGFTLDMIMTTKTPQIAISPEVDQAFQALQKKLAEKPELFSQQGEFKNIFKDK